MESRPSSLYTLQQGITWSINFSSWVHAVVDVFLKFCFLLVDFGMVWKMESWHVWQYDMYVSTCVASDR